MELTSTEFKTFAEHLHESADEMDKLIIKLNKEYNDTKQTSQFLNFDFKQLINQRLHLFK